MAFKYSQIINLMRDNYKGVIKASDPDFAGFCTNAHRAAQKIGVTYVQTNITSISLDGINHINFNSNNKNWQMLYPFQGTIHFFIGKNDEQKNNYIRFGWNTLLKYLQTETIPIKENNFSIYMNYFYADPQTPSFNFWGDDFAIIGYSHHTLPRKNTWNNGNVKFTDLKTNENGFGDILFFAAKVPYSIDDGWSTGVGFIFKDIHKNIDFFKKYVDRNTSSRYNFNVWSSSVNPLPSKLWAYDIDILIKGIEFSQHDRNDYEEINLDNEYIDFK